MLLEVAGIDSGEIAVCLVDTTIANGMEVQQKGLHKVAQQPTNFEDFTVGRIVAPNYWSVAMDVADNTMVLSARQTKTGLARFDRSVEDLWYRQVSAPDAAWDSATVSLRAN
ncbi:hypothetical protein FOL47_003602 [Perkinsus chesapeaki]|uniref:Uncharacterized protein n=1 Tax=Perkinsus chesapeaki TaxID=330153 RepID=A0A7J6M755_PERCH|nr:hypothetical protein FOL47_003602 [Perkinsus chesapeaki]